jgi:hypothetical protein
MFGLRRTGAADRVTDFGRGLQRRLQRSGGKRFHLRLILTDGVTIRGKIQTLMMNFSTQNFLAPRKAESHVENHRCSTRQNQGSTGKISWQSPQDFL